jgi:hypothetical protein
MPLDAKVEPEVLVVQFVNQQREVVSSLSVELARPPVRGWNGRGWRRSGLTR